MAEQAPRSIANMVFVVLIAIALVAFAWGTVDMARSALLGPAHG